MSRAKSPKRTGASRIEVLLLTIVSGTLTGLLLMVLGGCQSKTPAPATEKEGEKPGASGKTTEKPGLLEVQRRKECFDNLRMIGLASINFESSTGGLPSDKRTDFKDESFYTQLLDYLELQNLHDKEGKPIANGKAKPYLCPARRTVEQAPGARDYGYVASEQEYKSILDAPGQGIPLVVISNGPGTANTAMLSHIWLAPTKYSSATPGWASTTGHSVPKGKRGYSDTDPAGEGSLGSLHPDRMPCLFADGHVAPLPYDCSQFREIWDYTGADKKPRKLPKEGEE